MASPCFCALEGASYAARRSIIRLLGLVIAAPKDLMKNGSVNPEVRVGVSHGYGEMVHIPGPGYLETSRETSAPFSA